MADNLMPFPFVKTILIIVTFYFFIVVEYAGTFLTILFVCFKKKLEKP